MNGISIVMPLDGDRTEQFVETVSAYEEFGYLEDVELIIVTRTYDEDFVPWLNDYKIVTYEHKGEYFNPSKALNLGVINAKYENILITCPEVKPLNNVIRRLKQLDRGNYICQVYDETQGKTMGGSLVNSNYRCSTPSMYFLALFKKEDILAINGWDEKFMDGYAYEDNDFGSRFVRAGLKFEVRNEIVGFHQWHPRNSLGTQGARINNQHYLDNERKGVTFCECGITKRNN